VIKIVGDAVHAMFGAPVEQPDHAARAVDCALAIDAFASAYATGKRAEGIPLGMTRIGVNSGDAIVGNFGGESYFDYTAHGDAINVAARLESVNKQLGTRICVSASTVSEHHRFHGRPIGELVLKGKSEPLEAYEPLSGEASADRSTSVYLAAYEQMRAGDPAASRAFAAYVGDFGDDPLATFHLRRLLAGQNGARFELAEK
jgi:adenylate cyclase